MSDVKQESERLSFSFPEWPVWVGVGALTASVCAGVYCLIADENAGKGGDLATPGTAHRIIDAADKR